MQDPNSDEYKELAKEIMAFESEVRHALPPSLHLSTPPTICPQ